MRIAYPWVLWLLGLTVLVGLGFGYSRSRRRRKLADLGEAAMVAQLVASVARGRQVVRMVLFTVAIGLLVVALARPQAGAKTLQKQVGLDLVVALDFSKSMRAKDIYPTRLERAKRELEQLMDTLGGDRVGLVAFAGETLSYPPTTDYEAVKLFWRDLGPEDMPVGGTAMGRAMAAALEQLKRLRRADGGQRGPGHFVADRWGGHRKSSVRNRRRGRQAWGEDIYSRHWQPVRRIDS